MTKHADAVARLKLHAAILAAFEAATAHADRHGYDKPYDRLSALTVALGERGLAITRARKPKGA